MPRNFATTPSPEKVKELAGKREEAQKALAALRKEREGIISKLEGHAVNLIRSCNDIGILYGGITQTDICDALIKDGFTGIKQRDVRIGAVIKRVGDYDLHIKFESDLEATVKLHVKPDRELDMGKRDERHAEPAPAAEGEAPAAEGAAGKPDTTDAPKAAKPEAKGEKKPKGEKPAKDAKPAAEDKAGEGKPAADTAGEKPAKGKGGGDKAKGEKGKGGKDDAAPAPSKSKTGWGTTAEVPQGLADLLKPKRERRERR